MRKAPDYLLLLTILILIGMGVIMIFSTTPYVAFQHHGNSFFYIHKHLASLAVGLIAFLVGTVLNYRFYRKKVMHFLSVSVGFLALTFIPQVSILSGGSARWLRLGPLSFQPSELVKIAVIFFVAHAVTTKKEKMKDLVLGVFPVLLLTGFITFFIFLQPDLGTSIIIMSTVFIIIFMGGASFWHLFIISLLGLRLIAWAAAITPYQKARLMAFIDPWKYESGIGFHIIQSLIAVGSGGLFGLGIGHGKQKFAYLPQQFTDFIFAVLCEEGGFIIAALIIFMYMFFIFRGYRIALTAPDRFGQILAAGIVTYLGLQAFLNIAIVLGLLPVTGIPLPFISYGGTAMVVNLFAVGVLTNISQYSKI